MKLLEKKAALNTPSIEDYISNSWKKIASSRSLKNFIAVNPLSGFEDLPFEKALDEAKVFFQQRQIPKEMEQVNRESIKWLQVFFDQSQAVIGMPLRHLGLLRSVLTLIKFDRLLDRKDKKQMRWFNQLPKTPQEIITKALLYLEIKTEQQELFLTLLLTTLPGWAAHVKYRTEIKDLKDPHECLQSEYLALRLVLLCIIWPNAKQLITLHVAAKKKVDTSEVYKKIVEDEALFQKDLMLKLESFKQAKKVEKVQAQLVFCMDVRSEPFRRILEGQGEYQTFGGAGFFGMPVSVKNSITDDLRASCPILFKPAHQVIERPSSLSKLAIRRHKNLALVKRIYHSMKYSFLTPFSLVETLGAISGIWMGVKTFLPSYSAVLKKTITSSPQVYPDVSSIPPSKQIAYAKGFLEAISLTENFASLVVFCGHSSGTENNAYSAALDCGACGGNKGGVNAMILSGILNSKNIRDALKLHGIDIPQATFFLAAEHNTTTDEVELYTERLPKALIAEVDVLKENLQKAGNINSLLRSKQMGVSAPFANSARQAYIRSKDWSSVRPEWGLAGNAALIIGPRNPSVGVDLKGQCFLHSYRWKKDLNGSVLRSILTGPMIVAQSINAQYFFSTYDNVAFGAGSKVTKNITGKMGAMQGNASDLMCGLPLQSVYETDRAPYHKLLRLTVIIFAPKKFVQDVIEKEEILKRLFENGWIHLIHMDKDC